MEILALFFLGVLQGLTEFLPVSSSGHLVLFSKIFGIEESFQLSIILHFATLLSILVVLRKEVLFLIRKPLSKQSMMICVATIPTCIIAVVLMPLIKGSFSGSGLAICFFVTACLLFLSEEISKNKKQKQIDFRSAFWIGVAQGIATFPGISRSGMTISAGLFLGRDRDKSAKFSFLLSLPIILVSVLIDFFEIVKSGEGPRLSVVGTVLAFLSAFVVGVCSIKVMIRLTQKSNLKWFSVYLVLIGIVAMFVL